MLTHRLPVPYEVINLTKRYSQVRGYADFTLAEAQSTQRVLELDENKIFLASPVPPQNKINLITLARMQSTQRVLGVDENQKVFSAFSAPLRENRTILVVCGAK